MYLCIVLCIYALFYVFFCVVLCIFCVVLCIVCFVTYSVLFMCICVLNYCHRVATQLQLSISYHFGSGFNTAPDSQVRRSAVMPLRLCGMMNLAYKFGVTPGL